jgi:hypothetical protein
MDIEVGSMKAFPHDPVADEELVAIESCEACETRPATGVGGLCAWCGPQVAGVVGEMQA